MSLCPNCGNRLTCGCQRRVANNGKACCQKCVASVNAQPGVIPPAQPTVVRHTVVVPPPKK